MSDDAKRLILARRARFVAAAVASVAVSACGGETTTEPQPCLKVSQDAGSDADDAAKSPTGDSAPEPCLGMPEPDAEPGPCLSAPAPDGG